MKMEIIFASQNVHEIRELRDMLRNIPNLEILTLHHFPNYVPPLEHGTTFQENAIMKAEHASESLNRWVIAEDSGLIVPALKGAPGIFSDCYAGIESTEIENRRKLLKEMKSLPMIDRAAYYECTMVLASPKGMKKCVTGTCEGAISLEEKGRYGFGYDSIFIKNDYEKTFGEIDETVKNKISHRRKAIERMLIFLENLGK